MQRFATGLVAVLAWAAEVLFVEEQLQAGSTVAAALWRTSSYLTDLSTLAAAVVYSLLLILGPRRVSPFWRAAGTVPTIVVGILFAGIGGLEVILDQGASSLLAHLVVPILAALVWIALPHGGLRWSQGVGLAALVAAYLAVMYVRAMAGDGYPYPFVDVAEVGWSGSLEFAAIIMLVAAVVSLLLIGADGLMAARRAKA